MKMFFRLIVIIIILLIFVSCFCTKYQRFVGKKRVNVGFEENMYRCGRCSYKDKDCIEKEKRNLTNSEIHMYEKFPIIKPLIEYKENSKHYIINLYKGYYYAEYLCNEYDIYETLYCYPDKIKTLGKSIFMPVAIPYTIFAFPFFVLFGDIDLFIKNIIETYNLPLSCEHCTKSKKIRNEYKFVEYTGNYNTEKENWSNGELFVIIDSSKVYTADENGIINFDVIELLVDHSDFIKNQIDINLMSRIGNETITKNFTVFLDKKFQGFEIQNFIQNKINSLQSEKKSLEIEQHPAYWNNKCVNYTQDPFSQPIGSCTEKDGEYIAKKICTEKMLGNIACNEITEKLGFPISTLKIGCDDLVSKYTVESSIGDSVIDGGTTILAFITSFFSPTLAAGIVIGSEEVKRRNCEARVFNKCRRPYLRWELLQERPVEFYNECQEKFSKVKEIQSEIDRLNKKLENLNQLQASM